MSLGERLGGVARTLLEIDHEQFDRVFTLSVLVVIGTMLVLTPGYREDSQLFPYVIGIPTFGLLLFLLAIQFSSRLRSTVSGYASADLFDLDSVVSGVQGAGMEGGRVERTLVEERRSVVAIVLWTLLLFGLVWLVGFLPGTLVFMLVFYRVQADQPWSRAVIYSAVMWLFIVVIFEVALNTPFYTGILDVEVPLPF